MLFVGVLERYKGIDTLLEAWRQIAQDLPEARLRIVGTGRRARAVAPMAGDPRFRVRWTPALSSTEIAKALDESTVLVLPSRMEGMGRVIIEAFARGRAVVGARAGGIVDLVDDERNGILVDPGGSGAARGGTVSRADRSGSRRAALTSGTAQRRCMAAHPR